MNARRLLVVGSGGLLGRALVEVGIPGLSHAECDVTDPAARERALDRYKPDAVLFCAAVADVDVCERDPATRRVNVDAPVAWAHRVPTWYVSTNYVFSGPGPHGPADPVRPLQRYGHQKAEAEAEVLRLGSHVVRTAWLFGPSGWGFISSLPALLARGQSVRGIIDVPVQPSWTLDVARFLVALPEGISHAVGAEETTWHAVAIEVAHRLGRRELVTEATVASMGLAAPRPMDARLRPAVLPGWSTRIEEWMARIRGRG